MTKETHIPTITIEEWNEDNYYVIDVRSPKEYQEFHIPGAINYPLFTNTEREKVGTTYKQVGKEQAKQLGIEIVSPKLPGYYKKIKQAVENEAKPLLIYCARGGMRSKSLTSVLQMMGLPCYQLEGGIRAFRYKIIELIETQNGQTKPFYVLEGHTGTMKTELLHELQQEGYPVLDLEGMAGHRGSIFGRVGMTAKSQKQFELELYERLHQLQDSTYFIIESESRRIGPIVLPEWIMQGKQQGVRLHIHYDLEQRINHICRIYEPEKHKDELLKALNKLKNRLPEQIQEEITTDFEHENYPKVVEHLLLHYYDPKYEHSAKQYCTKPVHIQMKSFENGLEQIRSHLESFTKQPL
jgi:tRNA 2-selenouridine synthase